jgi:DNA-directed RNA polymerase subunit alpha
MVVFQETLLMAQGLEPDLKQLVLFDGSFGPREIGQMAGAIAQDFSAYRALREAVGELEVKEDLSPAGNVRLGVCLYMLGRYQRAIDALQRGDGGALAHFYMAKAHFALEDYQAAIESYDAAGQASYARDACVLGRAEAVRYAGDPTEALALLDGLSGAVEQTAEYLYQRGATVAALGGNPDEVVALFERAVDADGNHPGALFGLAVENDRRGNDDQAVEFYQRSVGRFPPHVGSLLNLGLLYEDQERYERAMECYQRILDAYPNHPQAALYMKDAQASGDMYYDEDAQKRRDRMTQVLSIPVTDFELSVRNRNCLQKMGIRTLGDLCRHTEQELLASKNFGETSLVEIKEMLSSKGLKLGQLAPERHALELFEPDSLSAAEQALLARPISDLSLSVRARKCMIRLGITTVGELIRRTGDELLECKNFGVTSLNEVRDKLSQHSLKLRGD